MTRPDSGTAGGAYIIFLGTGVMLWQWIHPDPGHHPEKNGGSGQGTAVYRAQGIAGTNPQTPGHAAHLCPLQEHPGR
jgi:hypothetical protein